MLGRDLAWFNGPLSQYFNALVFTILGDSLRSLILINFALALSTVAMLYLLLRVRASRFAATAGGLGFVLLCGFSQHEGIANFNWLCPYSHEITHGVLLGLATTLALTRWLESGKMRFPVLAGLAFGACFLTKPETFLAAAVATLAAFALAIKRSRFELRAVGVFAISAALPIALMWSWLVSLSDAANASSLVVGAWKHVGNPDLSSLLFYRSSLGLDVPGQRLAILGVVSLIWGAVIVISWLLGRGIGARRLHPWILPLLALPFVAPALLPIDADTYQQYFEVAFTPLGVAAGILVVLRLRDSLRAPECAPDLVFGVFALALLAKLGLYTRIHHYGFALAAPALAVVIASLVGPLPRWCSARGGNLLATRAALVGFVALFVVTGMRLNAKYRAEKTVRVGYGADEFRAVDTATFLNMTLDPLLSIPEDATFLCLPEGVMLNYLARRKSPIRVINFMPPEFVMFGEDSMLRELESNRPDYVLVSTRLTTEYGLPLFGRDYARGVLGWLQSRYEIIQSRSIGPDPLDPARIEDRILGWRVWKKK